jgi:DNA-binding NtrC family response regulator
VSCQAPFEKDARLCGICRLAPVVPLGLGRCSRMVVESPAMQALLRKTGPVAATSAPVVVLGESGSGKEVLARAMHANSPRKTRPFVAVNVAALPGELLESELFGHAKGAFTGAVSAKQGLLTAAHQGTLLLDEIGEMPLQLQAKLLRALQDGEVRPVGETRSIAVDVRIICATNRDLFALVQAGRFREDLYYRLKVFVLRVPPLRERLEDIVPLVRMFLEREGRADAKLRPAVRRALETYPWPGNVRELQNAIVHAVALAQGGELAVEHLPEELSQPPKPARSVSALRSLGEVEREHVESVLAACGGNQSDAAGILGIGRNTLWRKLRGWEEADEGASSRAKRAAR